MNRYLVIHGNGKFYLKRYVNKIYTTQTGIDFIYSHDGTIDVSDIDVPYVIISEAMYYCLSWKAKKMMVIKLLALDDKPHRHNRIHDDLI